MTVTETLNDGLKRGFELTIAASAIAARVDNAIAEVAPQIRMPGFRPGKVPGNLVRRMHGEALRREAVQEAVNEAVTALLAERGMRPATQPQVDLDAGLAAGEDVKVALSLELLPEVPDADLEEIALERLTAEPTDADITSALAQLAEQQKSFSDASAKSKAKAGDLVVMDYIGSIDGIAFDGGTGTDMEVELGSGRLIPGFEDGLLGVKAGDARDVQVTFPADYPQADLAGRAAAFAVTVKAVRQPELPPIDDTLAVNLGLESLDKLKDILRDQVQSELAGLTRTYMKRKLLDHLAAAHTFQVPPSMVEAEFAQIWRQVTADATEADVEALEADRADYGRIAERRVRLGLLLSDIGQKNGVQVTQAEMSRLVAQEAARFPGQEREIQKYFSENAMAAAQLRAPLFEEKVVDFLLAKASATDRPVSRAELEAAIESEDETPIGHVHGPGCGHDHHDHAGHDHHGHEHAAKPAKKPAARKAAKADEATEAVPAKAGKKAAAAKAEGAAVADDVPTKKAPVRKKAAD